MAQPWPVALQEILNRDSFTQDFGDTAITTEMEIGIPKKRRRYTKSFDIFRATINMTFAEYSTLKTFYDTTLGGGVLTFLYDHPMTQVETEFQFVNPPSIAPLGSGGEYFRVSMEWREIP